MSIGHKEFPAASYDEWKTRSPDDDYYRRGYYDDDEPPCDHEEYDVDWEGRATCDYCNAHWWLTAEQHEAWDRAQAEWAEAYDREQRRERSPLWCAWRWLQACWRSWRAPKRAEIDDEVPF